MHPPETRPLDWTTSLVMVVGVYVAATVSIHYLPHGGHVAAFWPASGLAIGITTLTPWRHWLVLAPAIGVAVVAANLTGGVSPGLSLVFGLANATEAVVAALVLTSGAREVARLQRTEDVVRLIAAATLGGGAVAAVSALGVHASTGGGLGLTAATVFVNHAAAALVVLPVVLVRRSGDWAGQHLELGLQLAALSVVTIAVFRPGDSPVSFLPVPFLAWAALRFDRRVAAWEVAGFGVVVTLLSAIGDGPFGGSAHAGLTTQGYLFCAALMCIPLAVAVQQRVSVLEQVNTEEHLFRRNFTESLVGMLFVTQDPATPGALQITDLNDTAEQILGGDLVSLEGRRLHDLIALGPDFDEVIPELLSGEVEGCQTDAALIGQHGRRVTLALSLLSQADGPAGLAAGGTPVFSVQVLDVTSQFDAQRQLEVAEQLTRTTLDTAACMIMVTDLEGTIVRINVATTETTGYPSAELVGRLVWDTAMSPSAASDVEALFVWPNRSGVPVSRERDLICRDGSKLRVMWNINVVRDDLGNPAYAVMTGINVTAERTTSGLINHLMQASFTTALVGIDTSGLITVFNSGAQHLLGYTPEEVVGRPFIALLKFDELMERTGATRLEDVFPLLVERIGADGESRANDWTWVSSNGTERTVSMTLSIAEDAFASRSGLLCVGRDVTEQREGQEMLVAALEKEKTAVERLRALDEAKNDFVSTVSHELRTPITSIIGYTEMLTDGSFVEPLADQLPMLETIARNGQRLIVMCNDLLLLSGMDSGNVTWNHESVDLTAMLPLVEDSIRPLLLGRELRVSFDAPHTPLMVEGDRAQLERVMINLLSNAVKFTDNGGQIWVQAWADRGEALVSVSDSGIGIPEAEQGGLFQKFFRSSTAQKRAIQGTGLGLSIVDAIVEAHGGRIDVRSAHMQGTTFTLRFPLTSPARTDIAPRYDPPHAEPAPVVVVPVEPVLAPAPVPVPVAVPAPVEVPAAATAATPTPSPAPTSKDKDAGRAVLDALKAG